MAIKPHPTPTPSFTVANKFPDPPKFSKPEDQSAFERYHEDMLNVLTRQFTALTAAIDKKADKP